MAGEIVKVHLESLIPILKKIVVDCTDVMFGKQFSIIDDWQIVERIEGSFDNIFSLGCANNNYQSIIIVGVQNDSIDLVGETDNEIQLIDIFGELANSLCGLLMDYKEFTDVFGFMEQAVPLHSLQTVYFPKAWSICGSIVHDNKKMVIGFALRGSRPSFASRLT